MQISTLKPGFVFGVLFVTVLGCVSPHAITPALTLLQCQATDSLVDHILGGEKVGLADPDQYLVTLLKIRKDSHYSVCTGSLISDRVVLTAAHCVDQIEPEEIFAHFKTRQMCPLGHVRTERINVKKIILHKNFDGTPQSLADLALLFLANPAPPEQQRLPVINTNKPMTEDKLLLIGFGITQETKNDAMTLRRVFKSLKEDVRSKDRALYVDQSKNQSGFCRGDSGAPIIAEIWGEPHIVAVNSANIGISPNTECQTMSMALNVLHFNEWIIKNKKEFERSNWIREVFSPPIQKL